MPFLLANPWGLLALLGIPAVLAIHFLHRQRKAIPVSTLFLIDIAREPTRSGRRWHRLIPSIPMWLQLLLVLLLTALLARPQLPQGVLRVAVILDDSASMRAFRSDLARQLTHLHQESSKGRRGTHWLVLPANPTRPRLYSGDRPTDWIATLDQWTPSDSWHDPSAALRVAREQVGPEGLVIYATDTPREDLPVAAALLSVGHPLENVGVGGISFQESSEGVSWQAVLVNPSDTPAQRQWTLSWNGTTRSNPQTVTLPARGMASIGGLLPANASRCELELSEDGFPLDDKFPFVRPEPKPLTMALMGEGIAPWLPDRLQRSIPRLKLSPPAAADFAVMALAEGSPPAATGVVISNAGKKSDGFLGAVPASTNHPLVRGLSWSGLAVQDVPFTPPLPDDEVLIWSGDRPLISLRMAKPPQAAPQADATTPTAPTTPAAPVAPAMPPAGPQLVLHFNPSLSNLDRLPAGAILFLRFAESLREAKAATAWEQLEPGQSLLPFLSGAATGTTTVESLAANGSVLRSEPLSKASRAPDQAGFLRVRNPQTILLEAGVAFADSREGDFRDCRIVDTSSAALEQAARVTTIDDQGSRLLPLILATLALLLILYHFSNPADSNEDDANTMAKSIVTPDPSP